MTETGYGGAVDCDFHCGCHLREDELLVEVVDPVWRGGAPGAVGEIVISTLRRRGAPLLRYRTGDRARFSKNPVGADRRWDGWTASAGASVPARRSRAAAN